MSTFQWIDDFHYEFAISQYNYFQYYCCCYQVDDSSVMYNVKNDAVPADIDETQSHMQPVVVKQEPDDVCCIVYTTFKQKQFLHQTY